MSEGNVYVLSNPLLDGFVKIGNTINIDNRIGTLNTALPEDMVVEYVGNFFDYKIVERDAHNAFMPYHHNREWFKVAPQTAVAFLKHHRNLIDVLDIEEEDAAEDTPRSPAPAIQLDDWFEESDEFMSAADITATYVGNNYVSVDGIVAKYSNHATRIVGTNTAGADFWRVGDGSTIRQYIQSMV